MVIVCEGGPEENTEMPLKTNTTKKPLSAGDTRFQGGSPQRHTNQRSYQQKECGFGHKIRQSEVDCCLYKRQGEQLLQRR